MSIATFLLIIQILNGLGGAGVALLTIQKDLEALGLKPADLLPAQHLPVVASALHKAAAAINATSVLGNPDGGE